MVDFNSDTPIHALGTIRLLSTALMMWGQCRCVEGINFSLGLRSSLQLFSVEGTRYPDTLLHRFQGHAAALRKIEPANTNPEMQRNSVQANATGW